MQKKTTFRGPDEAAAAVWRPLPYIDSIQSESSLFQFLFKTWKNDNDNDNVTKCLGLFFYDVLL